jgi:hypothetical protein
MKLAASSGQKKTNHFGDAKSTEKFISVLKMSSTWDLIYNSRSEYLWNKENGKWELR